MARTKGNHPFKPDPPASFETNDGSRNGITYQTKHPVTGKPVKGRDLIKVPRPLRPTPISGRRTRRGGEADTFCNSTLPRVAVTVDRPSPAEAGLEPLGKWRKEFTQGEGPARADGAGATESLGGWKPGEGRRAKLIKPLKVLIFLRDVRSRVYLEQMKGRGTRVLSPTDLQSVSGEDARAKSSFDHAELTA